MTVENFAPLNFQQEWAFCFNTVSQITIKLIAVYFGKKLGFALIIFSIFHVQKIKSLKTIESSVFN